MPKGFDLNAWYDLGPMRPDEFGRQLAMPWSQAARDQQINRDALEDVRQEAAGFDTLARNPAGEVG